MRRSTLALSAALLACHPGPSAPAPTPAPAPAPAVTAADPLGVVELDVTEAQRRMTAGTLTSRALTQAYLARIAEVDAAGPTLRAVLELNPRALDEAETLDRERAGGRVRGPLHGVPVLLKDNIDATPMRNTAGSLAMADHHPRTDAPLVARLRAAGAVILGKTNLSEWANMRSSRSTSGWSSRGGQTRNPYALDRNPCGSSSGTGAAIAASLAAVGIGTETDGSIMCPAAVHALVGLKPSVGLVSRTGLIPISVTQDTAGPMARTVTDAAILLTAIAGPDARDPASAPADAFHDYLAGLRPDALKGRRLGVLRQAMGYHPATDAAMERAISTLRAAGAMIVDPVEIARWNMWSEPELDILLYEFKAGLDAYLKASGAPRTSLADVIAWNTAHAREVMPWFAQELLQQAQALGGLDTPKYRQALASARRLAWDEGLGATLANHELDAVIAPTTGPAWPTDLVLGDRYTGAGFGVAAVAGTPSLTVPMGDDHGLPLGLTFMGPRFGEAELLAFAYAFEQATHARRPPTYRATIP